MVDRISIGDVRASIRPDIKNHYTVMWFGRPLGNVITPAFYNSGWSANRVTYFRMLVAGLALILIGIPAYLTGLIGGIVFYLCFVLDCVDGNIARLRGSVTYYGKFLDGLSDFVFVLGAPVAAGVSLWLEFGSGEWLLAGFVCTFVSLTSQMVRSRLSFFREWMVGQSGPLDESMLVEATTAKRLQTIASVVYVNGTFFTPLLLAVPGQGRVLFLLATLTVQALAEIVWLAGTLKEARIILARSKPSIHSPDGYQARQGQVQS